jgi:hypothetical protein
MLISSSGVNHFTCHSLLNCDIIISELYLSEIREIISKLTGIAIAIIAP